MLFGTQAKLRRIEESLHVKIGDNTIDNVDHFKYLGVWLDQSLTWSVHIEKITKTVDKRVGVLRRIRSVLPQHTLNLLYKSLILPHFDYCDAVWGNSAKVFLSKLDTIQNSAGKAILFLPRRTSTHIILSTLGWEPLSARRNFHLNVLVYKSLTSTLPPQLGNVFNYAATAHSYNTRSGSQGNLVPPLPKTNSGKRKFAARGVNSFNHLPLTLKNPLPCTVASFKVQYKNLNF